MKLTARRFPVPAQLDDVGVGELFLLAVGQAAYTCLKVEGDFVVMGGPDLHGEQLPAFVDVRRLGGIAARVKADDMRLRPSHDSGLDFGVPREKAHGTIAIDADGDPYLVVLPSGMKKRGFVSFRTGKVLEALPEGCLFYSSWELSAVIGSGLWSMYARTDSRDKG